MNIDNAMVFNQLDFSGTLDSSNILVVGTTDGPVRSVAAHLATDGANVLLVTKDSGDLDGSTRLLGDGLKLGVADASKRSGVNSIVRRVKEHFNGPIAGVVIEVGDLSALAMSEPCDNRWDYYEPSVVGPHLLRSLLPLMYPDSDIVFLVNASVNPRSLQPYHCSDASRFAVAANFIRHSLSELPPGFLINALVSDPLSTERDGYSTETVRAICYLLSSVSRVSGGVLRAEAECIAVL